MTTLRPLFLSALLFVCSQSASAALIDGFESGDFSANSWSTYGAADWSIDSSTAASGIYSARSGRITHNQSSYLELELATSAGTVSFDYRVSSEDNFDYLMFYINDIRVFLITGDTGWLNYSREVIAGTHVFTWRYRKDSSVNSYLDTVWIDNFSAPLQDVSNVPVPATAWLFAIGLAGVAGLSGLRKKA
ncbi:VPLPA-CTERM sorting domain-containing protein [Porticoccus litoralis]|uniref:VPLPA-CTERM sorting domain-containing protein n=1 Tax=Porticoccus litoralis TaxID=434086 RepID=A0AAW8B3R9_9GAMM|nr:VPLPA-CTERM sorting domain-containing protein [Porticoccus litoralis]MDP1520389.1 VPLPA-CTERM sorting domain-containing protein [Porticoccus litoralis]